MKTAEVSKIGDNRLSLGDMLPGELKMKLSELGERDYRAKQIFSAIHARGVAEINELRQIPSDFRKKLEALFTLRALNEIKVTDSGQFSTKKFLFGLSRDPSVMIETVLISEKGRNTVCVSTQAGCNVGCEFCATARLGFRLNLTAFEIVSQVYEVCRISGMEITNVVYMGMGEPFLNYENMLKSLQMLTHEDGMNLPARRITVSTVGFKGRIRRFADDLTMSENTKMRKVKLALSLHSTDNGIREEIIPTSKKNKLSDLYEEIAYFYRKTGSKVTYEYIHFPGINDLSGDIKRLASLAKMVPSNINIIPFHPIGIELKKPLDSLNSCDRDTKNLLSNDRLNDLIAQLRKRNTVVNLRTSSGVDINAACGQLALAGEIPKANPDQQTDASTDNFRPSGRR